MNGDKFKFIDLFAGIGGMRLAFERIGGTCVFSSEWDESAQKTYEANFGEKPAGDITKIPNDAIPKHDVLLAGFPCQPFSIIGNKKGFADTRGTLFFEIERILSYHRPHCFLLENVKQLVSHDNGRTLKVILEHLRNLGYYINWKVINSLDFGIPQKRERVFIAGFAKNYHFSFPLRVNHSLTLKDILEKDDTVDQKHFASKKIIEQRLKEVKGKRIFYPSIWHENKGGNIGIHPFSCALRAGASYNYLLVNGVRRLTSRENLRLQGFPDSFKIVVPDGEVRKQAGNGVTVPVVEAVARQMMKAIKSNHIASQQDDLFPQIIYGQNKSSGSLGHNAKDKSERYIARKRNSKVAKAS
ncbi:MAG: DNA cytosine methyltransferase [Bacteroidota bacterium]|nr:DNA cytosine methyltransferase [Bacteroidota bacterium]